MVICMNKYLFPVVLSLCIGGLLAYLIINGYSDAENISVSKNAEEVYYLRQGVYSSKDNMENSMQDFEHYIYSVEDNMYNTYIGISKNKKNIEKLKGFYQKKGYDTYIETKITDNEDFLIVLGQYDEVLSETEDENAINVICNQVLAKYEEMVNGEYND